MSTKGAKQPEIQENFSKLIGKGTIQHAYLFEGAAGTREKRNSIMACAKSLMSKLF